MESEFQSGQEDVEAAFEFCSAIVEARTGARLRSKWNSPIGSRCRPSRSRCRSRQDSRSVRCKLVEHVAVQEPEQGLVDV